MNWFMLAQASSGMSDFMRQLPIPLILMFCGSGVLLVVVALVIVRARTQRAEKAKPGRLPTMPVTAAKSASPLEADLPDLDLLVSAPPAPRPAPAEAAPARTPRTGTYTVNLSDGDSAQAVEVVTILRDVVDGGLMIQMGGKTYRDLTHDETFRASFLKVMRELSPVVNQAAKAPKISTQETLAALKHEEPSTPPQTGSLRDLLTSDEPFDMDDEPQAAAPAMPTVRSAPPPPSLDGTMPGDLPRFSMDSEPQVVKKKGGLLGRTKTQFVPVPELNLAEAIEAYLQHKLRHTPEYAARSIHVHPSPDGGVAIEVDGTFYDAVGDVAEADVRGFLSAAIQEWQERNSRK
jgi:hypothetical protein